MEQQSASNMEPKKIICPHCGEHECFEETQEMIDSTLVKSYMCMSCGYSSSTMHINNSELINQYENTTAELIKSLKWVDKNTNLVWYPTVLNFPSYGIIFPDGTGVSDWKWHAAPAVDVKESEKERYPIPGQKDQFYTKRIDMSLGRLFLRDDFYNACKYLGFVK